MLGPETKSRVVSAAEALALLDDNGITPKASVDAALVIESLKHHSRLTAIDVVHTAGAARHELLVLPDATQNILHVVQVAAPGAPGIVCVSCVDEVGQRSGKGCTCTKITRRVCGENPEVSCISECSFCPNGGGEPPEKPAEELCKTSVPWSNTKRYTELAPGDEL